MQYFAKCSRCGNRGSDDVVHKCQNCRTVFCEECGETRLGDTCPRCDAGTALEIGQIRSERSRRSRPIAGSNWQCARWRSRLIDAAKTAIDGQTPFEEPDILRNGSTSSDRPQMRSCPRWHEIFTEGGLLQARPRRSRKFDECGAGTPTIRSALAHCSVSKLCRADAAQSSLAAIDSMSDTS